MEPLSGRARLGLCLLAGAVGTVTLLRVGRRFAAPWVGPTGVAIGAGAFLLLALLYPLVWARRQRRPGHDEALVVAGWQGLIRYCLAFDLALFGFQKIFHLQFFVPLGMLDLPFSSLSGEDLTWAYFRHSYPYLVVIGSTQLVGGLLLVFGRTRLLGAIVLVPVLVNIVLIDYFYRLPPGVLAHALVLLAGLVYLIGLDYRRLVVFFLRPADTLPHPPGPGGLGRGLLRWSVVYGPLLLVLTYPSLDPYPALTGKYQVRSAHLPPAPHPTGPDRVLTVVYLDIDHDCVFEFGSPQHRRFGTYTYAARTRQLRVAWRYPTPGPDTLRATLTLDPAGHPVGAVGTLGRQSVWFTLHRLPPLPQ